MTMNELGSSLLGGGATYYNDDDTTESGGTDSQRDPHGNETASTSSTNVEDNANAPNENNDNDNNVNNTAEIQDITPYDNNVRAPVSYNMISIETLESEEPDTDDTVMHVQLLRLKSGVNVDSNQKPTYLSYNRQKQKNTTKMYNRMLLCRDLSSSQGRVIYIIQGKEGENDRLWSKAISLKTNGVMSVGKCFTLICPDEITSYIQNDIPVVNVEGGAIPLKDPQHFNEVPINYHINSNVTRSFCINNCQIQIKKCFVKKNKMFWNVL